MQRLLPRALQQGVTQQLGLCRHGVTGLPFVSQALQMKHMQKQRQIAVTLLHPATWQSCGWQTLCLLQVALPVSDTFPCQLLRDLASSSSRDGPPPAVKIGT